MDEEDEDIVTDEMLEAVDELKRDEYKVEEIIDETIDDLHTIADFLVELQKFKTEHDDKLKALIKLLKSDSVLKKHKVLIFTEYMATARYLKQQLGKAGLTEIDEVDSAVKGDRGEIINQFAPYYNGLTTGELQEQGLTETRILISTDVLSEGLNLQDATRLINYDLHWNPVRLMQRIGRVDRRMDPGVEALIAADHPDRASIRGMVIFWNFLPPDELEILLRLYSRVSHKVLRISRTFGIEGKKLLTPDDDFDALKDFTHAYEGTTSPLEEMNLEYQKLLQDDPGLAERLGALPGRVFSGNPPYSKISSNLTPEMRAIVEKYRYVDGERIKEKGALQFEINLQDDYVKFFRFCEEAVDASDWGVLGLITNNGYISTPTLRGMRNSLLESFKSIWIVDLHGHLAKGEIGPDGAEEENVFDIVQGVSLFLGSRVLPKTDNTFVFHAERYGSRLGKYQFLQANNLTSTDFSIIHPSPPFYLFIPHDSDLAQEWNNWAGLAELFPKNSAGIITARDGLVIAENKQELAKRLERFSQSKSNEASIYEEFGFSESKRFDLRRAQSELRKLKSFSEPIRRLLHRPFDRRFVFFHPSVVWSLSRPIAEQMVGGDNLALVATRQVTGPQFEHAFVSRDIIEIKVCSHDRNTQIFPLFLHQNGELAFGSERAANINPKLVANLELHSGLEWQSDARGAGKNGELTPQSLFGYVYSILHCSSYRMRYFEFLRSDFPRVPLNTNPELFRSLATLGTQLVDLHLLESSKFDTLDSTYYGSPSPEVEKISYSRKTVWLDKAQTRGFEGVPENVWQFHIGGYQVCEKWLKDRKHRKLSQADIEQYQKIVVALSETIRLMAEIDKVIDSHGGWPAAFAQKS